MKDATGSESLGEAPVAFDPKVSEWGNPPDWRSGTLRGANRLN
jgi:hypothetical protein